MEWPPEANTPDEARALLDKGTALVTVNGFDALRERRHKRVFY